MNGPILVINPNSNEAVTQGLRDALVTFALPGGPQIECVTLTEGPFGIESQLDSDSAVVPLARLVESRTDVAAFVVACYSDPGIDACRSVTAAPVFGMQEAGVMTALARADRFGVIAIADASIRRHMRYLRRLGVTDRLAGERPLGISVDESARGTGTFDRLVEVGTALKADGADAILLGCAGLSVHRARLEAALSVPVIDPTQAAVAMALGTLLAAG